MKVFFNDWVRHDDVLCMPLYRRVFPEWYEHSWNPRAALMPEKRKHETFDAEKMEEQKEEGAQMSD